MCSAVRWGAAAVLCGVLLPADGAATPPLREPIWRRASGWYPELPMQAVRPQCAELYAEWAGYSVDKHFAGCTHSSEEAGSTIGAIAADSAEDCLVKCYSRASLPWADEVNKPAHLRIPSARSSSPRRAIMAPESHATVWSAAKGGNVTVPTGLILHGDGECSGSYRIRAGAQYNGEPVWEQLTGSRYLYYSDTNIWRCTTAPVGFGVPATIEGLFPCSSTAQGRLPHEVDWLSACGPSRPDIPVPPPPQKVAATATAPLAQRSVAALWRPEDPVAAKVSSCRCRDVSELRAELPPAETEADDKCPNAPNTWEVYRVPLGCLFTGRDSCVNAPADSCVWLQQSECCVDAVAYEQGQARSASGWVWLALSCSCGLVVVVLCAILFHVARTALARRRQRREGSARMARAVAAASAASAHNAKGPQARREHLFHLLAAVMAHVPRAARPAEEGGEPTPCAICLESTPRGTNALQPDDAAALTQARRALAAAVVAQAADPAPEQPTSGETTRSNTESSSGSISLPAEMLLSDISDGNGEHGGGEHGGGEHGGGEHGGGEHGSWGVLACGHRMHRQCLECWFLSGMRGGRKAAQDPTCPMCRAVIPDLAELISTVAQVMETFAVDKEPGAEVVTVLEVVPEGTGSMEVRSATPAADSPGEVPGQDDDGARSRAPYGSTPPLSPDRDAVPYPPQPPAARPTPRSPPPQPAA